MMFSSSPVQWLLTAKEASQLSQSVYFVATKAVKNNFQEKELSHKCSTLDFVAAASFLENWRPGTLTSLCDQQFFSHLNPLQPMI